MYNSTYKLNTDTEPIHMFTNGFRVCHIGQSKLHWYAMTAHPGQAVCDDQHDPPPSLFLPPSLTISCNCRGEGEGEWWWGGYIRQVSPAEHQLALINSLKEGERKSDRERETQVTTDTRRKRRLLNA